MLIILNITNELVFKLKASKGAMLLSFYLLSVY